jgi:hypothetical protein
LDIRNFFDDLQIDTKKISKVMFQEDYSKNEFLIKKYSRIATLVDESKTKI